MRGFVIIFLLLVIKDGLKSQTIDTSLVEITIENTIENISNENSGIFLNEAFKRLHSEPINLNTCSKETLLEIPILPPEKAAAIIRYRKKKSFNNFDELKNILNNDDLYQNILPFVTLKNKSKNTGFNFTSCVANTIERSRGYDSVYLGNSLKTINKFCFDLAEYNISGGVLIEKDPGEKKINDFYSGHLNYKSSDLNIIVGDYLIEMGQGLCIGMPFSLSKSGNNISSSKKLYNGIKPFFSSAEYNYMRGMAAETVLDNFGISLFYSNSKMDAGIDSMGIASSLIQSGYHRSINEINKKNDLNEVIIGGKLNYKINSLTVGLNFYKNRFNKSLDMAGSYSFKGSESNIISIDYKAQIDNLYLFGELARSGSNSFAFLAGSIFEVSERLNFSLLFRRYPEDFINLHASSFSEGEIRNEEGFYFGLYFLPVNFLKFNAYYDTYRFPYRTYFNPLPTTGKEFQITGEISCLKDNKFMLKYKNDRSEGTVDFLDDYGRSVDKTIRKEKQNFRFEINSSVGKNLRLRGRIEYTNLNYLDEGKKEKGLMVYNDISVKIWNNLSLGARVVFFETDSYYSGIYEYESEIDGIYNNISLFGKGERRYFIINYILYDIIDLTLKYSYTYYDDVKTIGSGYDLIPGNVLNKISFQLNINL